MRCTRSTLGSSSPQSACPASWKATTCFSCGLSTRRERTPGDDPLERTVEVLHLDHGAAPARRPDRRLVADVGQVGAGEAARLRGDELEVDHAERLVAGVHLEHADAALDSGRRDEHLAVEAARAQERRVELLEQVGRRDHDDASARGEAVHLDQQLVERLVLLAGDVHAAVTADGVELVDEDDRRLVLARLGEQPPDAGGAEAGEHLDERCGRLGEELRAGLAGDRLGQQRLAGAGRPVQQHALGHAAPSLRNGRGSRRNSTISCSSAFASSAPAMSSQPIACLEVGAIFCGLTRGMTFSTRHIRTSSSPKKNTMKTGCQA